MKLFIPQGLHISLGTPVETQLFQLSRQHFGGRRTIPCALSICVLEAACVKRRPNAPSKWQLFHRNLRRGQKEKPGQAKSAVYSIKEVSPFCRSKLRANASRYLRPITTSTASLLEARLSSDRLPIRGLAFVTALFSGRWLRPSASQT